MSEQPYPKPGIAWYATIALAFLYWLSILDRFIISLLVGPIKKAMGISDVQFGMLHGLAFAVTFSVFGLFAGAMADRFNRRSVICACVAIWSVATTLCGTAANFTQLLIARIGVGAGEAGLNPSATSLISDMFPRKHLTSAMAVYTIGASVGSGTAYLLGGLIVDWVSKADTYTLPVIGAVPSWQAVFFIIGVPGIFASLIAYSFPEPARRDRKQVEQTGSLWTNLIASYKSLLVFIRSQWQFFASHYIGFAVASIVLGGCGVWYPAHMGRTFGWSASEIGLTLGSVLVISSVFGKLLCGFAVDALYRKGYRDAQFRWYAGSLAIGTPIGIFATTAGDPITFLSAVSIFLILAAPLPACYTSSLNLVTPNELRGAGIAFFSGTAGLIGLAAGPILIAAIGEAFFEGPASIGYGMAVTIGLCCPIAAIALALGCKAMRNAALNLEQATVTDN